MAHYIIRFKEYRTPYDRVSNTVCMKASSLADLRHHVYTEFMDTPEFREIAHRTGSEEVMLFSDQRSSIIFLGRMWLDGASSDGIPTWRPLWRGANEHTNCTVDVRNGAVRRSATCP